MAAAAAPRAACSAPTWGQGLARQKPCKEGRERLQNCFEDIKTLHKVGDGVDPGKNSFRTVIALIRGRVLSRVNQSLTPYLFTGEPDESIFSIIFVVVSTTRGRAERLLRPGQRLHVVRTARSNHSWPRSYTFYPDPETLDQQELNPA